MSNHLNSDQQLDQAVKEALESYEAPFDSSAWADMEKQLAAQPKPLNPFKKFSFSLNTIIAIGVVAGGLIIYKLSASNNDHTEPVQKPVVTNSQPAQSPKNDPPAITAAPVVTKPADTITEQPLAPVVENTNTPASNFNAGTYNRTASSTQGTTKNRNKNTSGQQTASGNTKEEDFDFMKIADQASKSAPAFGDQLDGAKGFIKPSSESADVKREAANKASGWGDQVLKTMKTDTVTFPGTKTPGENNSSDEGSAEKSSTTKKPKTPKKSTSKDSSSSRKSDSTSSSNESSAEKDSTSAKKVKGKNTPKYQSDKPIFEQ